MSLSTHLTEMSGLLMLICSVPLLILNYKLILITVSPFIVIIIIDHRLSKIQSHYATIFMNFYLNWYVMENHNKL